MGQFTAPLPFCSVRIQYSGPPGSLEAQVSSVESQGNLVVDSHVMNEGNPWAGSGANPWHLDQDTESILFLTNESDQATRIGFKINANGAPCYFLTSLLLNPHETRAIDLRKLRDAQKPDFNKNKVPAGAADGSVIWIRGDNLPVMGRLMLIHRRQGMASNYDCNQCACPYTYDPALNYANPASQNIAVGQNFTCHNYGGFQDCNHNPYYYDETASTSYTPGDNTIASIGPAAGQVNGLKGGSTTITGQFSDYIYQWNQQMWYCASLLTQGSAVCTDNNTPTITGISPAAGLIGANTSVTISGSGFGATQGSSTVIAAGITISYNSWCDTQIGVTFQVPSDTTSGNHTVYVDTTVATSNGVNFYVQVPTSLKVLGVTVLPDGSGPPYGCPGSANYGIMVDIKYLVQDQNTTPQPIQSASMTPHEKGTFYDGTNYDNNVGPVQGYPTSSATTASDGTFHDVPNGVCRSLPISNPGLTATQNITMILPGATSYPVRSQSLTVTAPGSGSFGHGTITNGSDINASR